MCRLTGQDHQQAQAAGTVLKAGRTKGEWEEDSWPHQAHCPMCIVTRYCPHVLYIYNIANYCLMCSAWTEPPRHNPSHTV